MLAKHCHGMMSSGASSVAAVNNECDMLYPVSFLYTRRYKTQSAHNGRASWQKRKEQAFFRPTTKSRTFLLPPAKRQPNLPSKASRGKRSI
jgi:hypothetical protein